MRPWHESSERIKRRYAEGAGKKDDEKGGHRDSGEETYEECMKRMMGELYDKRLSDAIVDCLSGGEELGMELMLLAECARLARWNWFAFKNCVERTLGKEVLECILGLGGVGAAYMTAWGVAHKACEGKRRE